MIVWASEIHRLGILVKHASEKAERSSNMNCDFYNAAFSKEQLPVLQVSLQSHTFSQLTLHPIPNYL